MNPFRVYACESQPVVVEGLVRVFETRDDMLFAGFAEAIDAAIAGAIESRADVLLIGQPPTSRSALPLLATLQEQKFRRATILWVSEISDMDLFRALQMGARGIVTRTDSIDALIECLREVVRGGVWLRSTAAPAQTNMPRRNLQGRITRREHQIIELICRGARNKDIAEALAITPGTVKVHLLHIFEKTGVRGRCELAVQGRHILGISDEPADDLESADSADEAGAGA